MRGAAVLAGGVRQRRVPDGRLCSRFFEAGKEGAKGGAARTSKMNALPAGSAILTWLGILRSSTVFEDRGETRRELLDLRLLGQGVEAVGRALRVVALRVGAEAAAQQLVADLGARDETAGQPVRPRHEGAASTADTHFT